MTPFRRRKKRREADLRTRARRARLAERERAAYERQRAGDGEGGYEAEGIAAEEAAPTEAVERPAPETQRPEVGGPGEAPKRRRGRRGSGRRRARPRLGGLRTASSSGARATVRQAQPGVRQIAAALGRLLAWPLAWLLRFAGLVQRGLAALVAALAAISRGALRLAERYATPERVLVLVTGGAAACLIVSQFTAYRGVEVGQPQYTSVSSIAPPPQTDRIDAGAAHAYVLVPLAALALGLALLALISNRWRLGRLVSAIGLVGIAISLAIDLPKGLDAGTPGIAFAGAKATLTNGFYAELAASAVLVLCGLVLSINLRRRGEAAARRPRTPPSRPRASSEPSVAGGGA
jgi:hypothetical protein